MASRSGPSSDQLVVMLDGRPEGASIDELETATGVPRRTLQRRLASLVREGRLRVTGKARSLRYHGVTTPSKPTAAAELTVSTEGRALRELIRQPLMQRKPVGYNATFLERYRPNVDQYLSPSVRSHLHGRGRAPGPKRPAGTFARQLLSRLLVDLSWASSRLEGNTYTRLDTQNLIELGRQAPGKDQVEAQMILNHKAAIEMLVSNVDEVGFNRYTLCNLHALLADNLLANASAAGRVRHIDVAISGTVYQPLAIPQRLEELFDQLLTTTTAIEDPFEQAFFVMVQLPYLQPFEDVNKRVSRLAANIPFIKHNLAPLSFVDVPERDYVDGTLAVYELNRVELLRDVFVWAYERSCQRYTVVRDALPEPDPVRLRNREQLAEIVNAIVRDDLPIADEHIRPLVMRATSQDDVEVLIAMVIAELHGLHTGNLARFGLRPSEFQRWRGRRR